MTEQQYLNKERERFEHVVRASDSLSDDMKHALVCQVAFDMKLQKTISAEALNARENVLLNKDEQKRLKSQALASISSFIYADKIATAQQLFEQYVLENTHFNQL